MVEKAKLKITLDFTFEDQAELEELESKAKENNLSPYDFLMKVGTAQAKDIKENFVEAEFCTYSVAVEIEEPLKEN